MNETSLPAETQGFFEKYRTEEIRGLPKYVQLRQVLSAAIDHGCWARGGQLPTELELTKLTPFSLGTVQRAVRDLAATGRVVRVHGRGTFVSNEHPGISEPFIHARFLKEDGSGFLPVFSKILDRERVTEEGPWSAKLGQAGTNIVRIQRQFNVNDEFLVFSRFFINASRFAAFAKKSFSELNEANFKLVLTRDFHLPAITYVQDLSLRQLPAPVCRALRVRLGTVGNILAVTAMIQGNDPIYYHELFIPPNGRRLKLPDIAFTPGR